MTTSPDLTNGLEVGRADLSRALRIVARVAGKHAAGTARLRFEHDWLIIEAGEAAAKAPAQGVWPLTIAIDVSWVRGLASRLPATDPIRLRFDAKRLYFNRFSVPRSSACDDRPVNTEPPGVDKEYLIQKAAGILKPLCVSRDDVERLVSEPRPHPTVLWSEQEQKMIGIVAKARAVLAPLGVETSDIRRLVDNAIRNAWK